MFKPKYQINNELLANIKRISSLITQLNSQNINRLVYARLERLAREVSTHASTSIEGNPLPLTEVKKILKNRPENIHASEQEVLNYNQALKQVNDLLKTNRIQMEDLVQFIKEEKKIVDPVILQPWHRQILAYIKQHGYITNKIYGSLTVRARPTRHLDFRKLIGLGLITMKGQGRAAYYQVE